MSSPRGGWPRGFLAYVLLVLAPALAFANALPAQFVWDDFDLVVNNVLLRVPGGFGEIFRTDPFGFPLSLGQYYRPIQTVTFWIQYQLHGLDPMPYHLFNVALHVVDVLLLFAFLLRMRVGRTLAFLVSLAFSVHPLAVECVTFVAVRGDLLLLLFTLLSLHSLLFVARGRQRGIWIAGVVLSVVLALITKESAVVVPVLLGLAAWTIRPAGPAVSIPHSTSRSVWRAVVAAFVVTGVYVVIRATLHLGAVAPDVLSNIAFATPIEKVATVCRVVATDLRLLFFPYRLHIEYQFIERSLASPWVFLGAPLAVFVLLFLWWRAGKVESRLALFFLGWFVVGIGPFFQIVPLAQTMAERWLYLPGVGFLTLLVLAGASVPTKWHRPMASLFLVWVVALGIQTHLRNRDWRDGETLFGGDLALATDSFLVPHNYGVVLFQRGDVEGAKEMFELSIARAPGPGYGTAHNSLGSTLELLGDLAGAEREFAKSIRLSRYALAFSNRGRVLTRLGRPAEALGVLEDGLRSYPQNPDILYYLGEAHAALGQWAEAAAAWERIPPGVPGFGDLAGRIRDARQRAGAR
ncbi:MAG: tetratricopeptide repeat protein [Candidatus Eisenbacteria bacterium]